MTLTADADTDEQVTQKSSKMPLLIGVVMAVIGAAGGFFATNMGLLPIGSAPKAVVEDAPEDTAAEFSDVTFVALEPITVSLPRGSDNRLLRLVIQLDVAPENATAVEAVKPRIFDILNTYLHALASDDFEGSSALIRLRTHLLHRVQVVVGQGIVRDLLITEFVLN